MTYASLSEIQESFLQNLDRDNLLPDDKKKGNI